MPRTIAIIAPFIDTRQFNMDFTLRLAKDNRELTLATFYNWAAGSYVADDIPRGIDYSEDIPAAGFYLQSLLHAYGYETILTNRYDDETLEAIAGKDIFAVCISTTMIITTESLVALCASIRKAMPDVPVIAGGVNIWKNYFQYERHLASPGDYPMQEEMLFHPLNATIEADVLVVAQHGIASLLMVLGEMEKGKGRRGDKETRRLGDWGIGRLGELKYIPNLCLPGKEGFVFTKMVDEKVDYNEDYTRWNLITEMPEKVPLRTSIGCPYRCRFCDFCSLFPKVFLRSTGSLQRELSLVRSRTGNTPAMIHVTDDNVFITKKRLFEICGTLSGSGLNHWAGFMRGGEYSDDEMKAIIDSGLMMGKMGVESGDQGQLDRMNKRQDIEKVKRGIEQFDAQGIGVLMTFVVGFPGETEETLRNTVDFMNNLSLTHLGVSYQVYPLLIFNLSGLADPALRKKWNIEGSMDHWSHYTMNSAQAERACLDVFKGVTNVPYNYSEESNFFNRGMFDFETRKRLFHLRQQLTLMLIGKEPWPAIGPILREMAVKMELPSEGFGENILNEFSVPLPPFPV